MRGLKILVVVMGVLIVVGTLGLVVALVQKLGGAGGGVPEGGVALRQPAGSTIAGISASDGVVAVWVRRPDGERVMLVDAKRGRISGEIRVGD